MADRGEGYHQRVIRGTLTLGYSLLVNVRFAILQIATIVVAAAVGIALKQLPDYALQNAADYETEMARLRAAYAPTLGPLVGPFERLGLFHIFTTPWFSALLVLLTISIAFCTWDRLPKILAASAPSRAAQPDAFFGETLPGRGRIAVPQPLSATRIEEHATAVAAALRATGWEATIAIDPDASRGRIVLGDRHRRSGRFTLVSHAGLILLFAGAAISGAFGYTQGVLLTNGETLPVGRIGVAGGIALKNYAFSAPRDSSGAFKDFATDLGVLVDGVEVARATVRVNEPLSYNGWSFHQNFFGPSAALEIRDAAGELLWAGEAPFTAQADGSPYARVAVPGSDAGLELLLQRDAAGTAAVLLVASVPDPSGSPQADGSPAVRTLFASVLAVGDRATAPGAPFTVHLTSLGSYTGIIARRDPGAPIVWIAALLLVVGFTLTLRRPRARLWIRLRPGDSELAAALQLERGADGAAAGRAIAAAVQRLGGESAHATKS